MQGLGLKMKELRKKKQMTREALCGDESELSVRQLARIEVFDFKTSDLYEYRLYRRKRIPV